MKKYFNSFEDYLNEKKMSSSEIYDNHYRDIEPSVYKDIIESDPTSKNGVNGKYVKWLLNLHKNGSLKKEDYYKATSYLKAFNDFQHKFPIKDINQIKSIQDLFKMVKDYVIKEDDNFTNDIEYKLKGQFEEVFKTDSYRVIIPYTIEASKYFGRDTEWCTTHENQFDNYTKNQERGVLDKNCLYIMYSEDSETKYQFHFADAQFMDYEDTPIHIGDFFEENPELGKFFTNHLGDLRVYYTEVTDFLKMYFEDNNIKACFATSSLVYEFEEMEEELQSELSYEQAKKIFFDYEPYTRYADVEKAKETDEIFIIEIDMEENPMSGQHEISTDSRILINKNHNNPNLNIKDIVDILNSYSNGSERDMSVIIDGSYYSYKKFK
jgi:hypothetical protein